METIASFPDVASAEVAAALLRAHEIPVQLEPSDSFGQAIAPAIRLVVPSEQVRRVRWAIANSELSDSEYFFLATGELASGQDAAEQLAAQRAQGLGPAVALLGLAAAAIAIVFAVLGALWRL